MSQLTTCDCDLPWCLSLEKSALSPLAAFFRCDGIALLVAIFTDVLVGYVLCVSRKSGSVQNRNIWEPRSS